MGICPLLILHPAVQGEPEFHTAVYIYNTAVLVVGIHDGPVSYTHLRPFLTNTPTTIDGAGPD